MVTSVEFPVHITCKKGSPRVIKQQVDIGMHVIVLNPDCSADSKYFHVPKFASGESNKELIAKFGVEVGLSKLTESIWNSTHPLVNRLKVHNSSKIVSIPELSHMSKIPISSILSQLENVHLETKRLEGQADYTSHSTWVIFLVIIAVIVLTSVTVGTLCYYKLKGIHIGKRTHRYAVASVEIKDEAKAEESDPIRHQPSSSEEPHTSVLFLKNQ